MSHLTIEALKERLSHDPETGVFTRLLETSPNAKLGEVGQLEPHGYVKISVCGKRQYAHRLAWFYMTGAWPAGRLDHKNGNRSDNRWTNIREATHQQNLINRPARGTRFHPGIGRWTAQIGVNMKQIYLGAFDTEEAAHAAYLDAVRAHHGAEWLTRKAVA